VAVVVLIRYSIQLMYMTNQRSGSQGIGWGGGLEAKLRQKHEQYIQYEREETVIDQERAQ
jgi:hypothetical protein